MSSFSLVAKLLPLRSLQLNLTFISVSYSTADAAGNSCDVAEDCLFLDVSIPYLCTFSMLPSRPLFPRIISIPLSDALVLPFFQVWAPATAVEGKTKRESHASRISPSPTDLVYRPLRQSLCSSLTTEEDGRVDPRTTRLLRFVLASLSSVWPNHADFVAVSFLPRSGSVRGVQQWYRLRRVSIVFCIDLGCP